MVNLGEKHLNPKFTIDNEIIVCTKCKVSYKAEKEHISVKNPNLYYKWCQRCRDYQFQRNIMIRYKNKN